jgi:hypothetical protein
LGWRVAVNGRWQDELMDAFVILMAVLVVGWLTMGLVRMAATLFAR